MYVSIHFLKNDLYEGDVLNTPKVKKLSVDERSHG